MRGTSDSSHAFFDRNHTSHSQTTSGGQAKNNNMVQVHHPTRNFSWRIRTIPSISTSLGPWPVLLSTILLFSILDLSQAVAGPGTGHGHRRDSESGIVKQRNRRDSYTNQNGYGYANAAPPQPPQPQQMQMRQPMSQNIGGVENDDLQELLMDEKQDDVTITRYGQEPKNDENSNSNSASVDNSDSYALLQSNKLDPREAKKFAEMVSEAVLTNADSLYASMGRDKERRADLDKMVNSALQMSSRVGKYRIC